MGRPVIPNSEDPVWTKIKRNPELLLALSVAVITPLMGSLLRRLGIAHQARQIAYLSRRLELINKLKEFESKHYGTDVSLHDLSILDDQITDILQSLKKHSITPTSTKTINYDGLHPLRRVFLFYKPISTKGWVFLILFYIYLFLLAMSAFFSLIVIADSIGLGREEFLISTFFSVFYLVVFGSAAYAFHSAAAAEAKLVASHLAFLSAQDRTE